MDRSPLLVLPFSNMSSDPEQEYMSDGIPEELLILLAKIPELRVVSRTTAFSFKGRDNLTLREIAAQLGVAHMLAGSVRKSGNTIRITAQLIDARSDSHLFSEAYDRTLDDVFAIQAEIAAKVVDELKITLLGEIPLQWTNCVLPPLTVPPSVSYRAVFSNSRWPLAKRLVQVDLVGFLPAWRTRII